MTSLGLDLGFGFGGSSGDGTISPSIQLSANSIPEDAEVADPVGTLSVANGSGSYTFTLTDDAGGLFAIDGDELQVAGALDFDTAQSHQIEVEADNGVDDPITRIFTINVTNVGAASLAIDEHFDGRIFQRSAGETDGPVPISGTYTGTPTAIEVRVFDPSDDSDIVAWMTLDASPSAGAFSGVVTVPQGGPYGYEVRDSVENEVGAVASGEFFVGAWVGISGQSNANGIVFSTDGAAGAAAEGTLYYDGETDLEFETPAANTTMRTLANALKTLLGVPVGVFVFARNGVAIHELLPGADAGWYEDYFETRLAAIGGDFELVIFHQGEGDTAEHIDTPLATYQERLVDLHEAYAAECGRSVTELPFVFAGLGRVTSGATSDSDARWSRIQDALSGAHDPVNGRYFSHSNIDAPLEDDVHYTDAFHATVNIPRYLQTIGVVYGDETDVPAWYVTAAAYESATETLVTVTHSMGTDFTPTTDAVGFQVSDDGGGSWEDADADRVDATTILLTHASLGSTRLVRYLAGREPDISDLVLDNGALTSPLVPVGLGMEVTGAPAALPTPTYLGTVGIAAGSGNPSGSLSIGSAAADRYLIMGYSVQTASGTGAVTGCNVNPSGETPVAATRRGTEHSADGRKMGWFTAPVPAGTSATFDLTRTQGGGWANAGVLHVWSVPSDDLNSATPIAVVADTEPNTQMSVSEDIDLDDGGFVLVIGIRQGLGNTADSLSSPDVSLAARNNTSTGGSRHLAADSSDTPDDAAATMTNTALIAAEIGVSAIACR
jgi:hypothetical protein